MAQDLTNFGQRSALPQHLASQPMSELMRTLTRGINPRPRQRMPPRLLKYSGCLYRNKASATP